MAFHQSGSWSDQPAVPTFSSFVTRPRTTAAASVGIARLDIALVPAVLSELDGLKDQGKHQLIRDKARAAGTAIKALRQKGRLLDGVPVTDAVTVFSRPVEPDFTRLPHHLDPTVPDDRLLGAALELQRDRPRGIVVLLTGDVNLQTKAELVDLPFVELPPSAP